MNDVGRVSRSQIDDWLPPSYLKALPCVGLAPTHILNVFVAFTLTRQKDIENTPETPDGAFTLLLGFVKYLIAVESPLIGVLV